MLRFLNRPGVAEIEAAPSAVPEAPLLGLCEGLAARCSGERRRVGSEAVVMKGGPFSPSGARRHGLRRLLLRAPGPCAAEFRNLAWLRKRLLGHHVSQKCGVCSLRWRRGGRRGCDRIAPSHCGGPT